MLISQCFGASLHLQTDYFECSSCGIPCRGKMIRESGSEYARNSLSPKERQKRAQHIKNAKQRKDA